MRSPTACRQCPSIRHALSRNRSTLAQFHGGRPGLDLYPTLEVVPAKAKTTTFLAHSAVPVSITEEDFEQETRLG